jgi:hypothetical protein
VEGAGEVDVELALPVVVLDAHDELVEGDPGVVHEDVEAPHGGHHLVDRLGGRGRVGHVELEEAHLGGAGLAAEARGLLGGGDVAREVEGEPRPPSRQFHRDRPPDAPGGTGDEGGLSLEGGHGRAPIAARVLSREAGSETW